MAAQDVGLIPWVPLTQFDEPVEAIIQQCRDRIEQQATLGERANLLAVTQVFTQLRYNDAALLALLGGTRAMIDSPLIRDLLAQRQHQSIQQVLEERLGAVPPEVTVALQAIRDEDKLDQLTRWAARCPDLDAFRTRLASLASS